MEHSGRDKAQVTRIVRQLMERELLAREPDPNDGRRFNLQLTKKGLALQAQRKKLAADMLRDLNRNERQQLASLLGRMRATATDIDSRRISEVEGEKDSTGNGIENVRRYRHKAE